MIIRIQNRVLQNKKYNQKKKKKNHLIPTGDSWHRAIQGGIGVLPYMKTASGGVIVRKGKLTISLELRTWLSFLVSIAGWVKERDFSHY